MNTPNTYNAIVWDAHSDMFWSRNSLPKERYALGFSLDVDGHPQFVYDDKLCIDENKLKEKLLVSYQLHLKLTIEEAERELVLVNKYIQKLFNQFYVLEYNLKDDKFADHIKEINEYDHPRYFIPKGSISYTLSKKKSSNDDFLNVNFYFVSKEKITDIDFAKKEILLYVNKYLDDLKLMISQYSNKVTNQL